MGVVANRTKIELMVILAINSTRVRFFFHNFVDKNTIKSNLSGLQLYRFAITIKLSLIYSQIQFYIGIMGGGGVELNSILSPFT